MAPQMMKVEYEELIARAAELERPIGRGIPTEVLQPPCGLTARDVNVVKAAAVLREGADNMRKVLIEFDGVRQKLAQSLRNAAKAYRAADDEAAYAVSNLTPLSEPVMPGPVDGGPASRTLGALGGSGPTPDEMFDGMHTVEQIALQLEQGDQGASLERFAAQWADYKKALHEARDRFRKFREWSGDAASVVEGNFKSQIDWLAMMERTSGQMAEEAGRHLEAFRDLRKQHVWGQDISRAGAPRTRLGYQQLVAIENWAKTGSTMHTGYETFLKFYNEVTQSSKTALADFRSNAFPITPVDPTGPPTAADVKPPAPWKPVSRPSDEDIKKSHILKPVPRPWIEGDDDVPPGPPVPTPGGDGLPIMPAMPMMPMTPATPQTDPALADALNDLKGQGAPKLPHGGGVKPASFGGAGMPTVPPLQPWADDGATAKAAGAGASSGPGVVGRGIPGAGAMGGGMGGAPAPAGDKGGKGKRVPGDEDALYTEDRSWTEGVIGRRSAKDASKH